RVAAEGDPAGEGGDRRRLARRIATEGLEEIAERADRQVVPRDRVAEGEEDRIVDRLRILRAGEELLPPERQTTESIGARRSLVGDVVRPAREGVDRPDLVPPSPAP